MLKYHASVNMDVRLISIIRNKIKVIDQIHALADFIPGE
jgi:hypothetical protein